jgi:pimeloyl-ACP methyl ester carboxylesterase
MDIYLPKNDTLEKRPLMMFIHGGAFFTGDKATLPYQKWCTHFASLGYVCVSINYRMGFRISSKSIERTAYQATQDAHAAMRYLVSKKDVYRIDPDYLFVGGASAGSITALNLAYMRNKNRPESSYSGFLRSDLGGLETSGNRIYSKFKIKAVANMWGSVYDLEILKNSKASIISFHGDEDGILPYEYGYPFEILGDFKEVLFNEMYGSLMIHEKALELGIRSELHTFRGQGHSLHLDENRNLSDNFYVMQDEMVDFFYDELLPSPVRILQDENDIHRFTVAMTDVEVLDWNVVGGVVIEENEGEIRASSLEDEDVRELRVSGYYTNGACFEDVFVIENAEVYESNSY